MRKLIAVTAATALAGALAIPAFAATKTVKMVDSTDAFSPSSLTVTKGSKVVFKWNKEAHNVIAEGKKPFKNIATRTSGSVSRTANTKGRFVLLCTIHPGMELKLRVK